MILPWRKKNDAGPDERYFERHHVCGIVPFSLDTFAVQVSASALHMITNFLNFQERKDQWMPRCTLALQCWLRDLHANNLQYCSFISRSPQHLLPWPPSGLRGGISEAAWGTTFPPTVGFVFYHPRFFPRSNLKSVFGLLASYPGMPASERWVQHLVFRVQGKPGQPI